jgi:hypothetical protein
MGLAVFQTFAKFDPLISIHAETLGYAIHLGEVSLADHRA